MLSITVLLIVSHQNNYTGVVYDDFAMFARLGNTGLMWMSLEKIKFHVGICHYFNIYTVCACCPVHSQTFTCNNA